MMNKFKGVVILDAGHGMTTPGKCSPVWEDGSQLFEWKFNRRVVDFLRKMLEDTDIPVYFTHHMYQDTPLGERVRKANAMHKMFPQSFLVSVHANAGGGTGWECFTSPGKSASDGIASFLCYEAHQKWGKTWKMRFDHSDGDPDKEADFQLLTRTNCPAVLTENFFMDNPVDCRYIASDQGIREIAQVHYRGIMSYINDTYN